MSTSEQEQEHELLDIVHSSVLGHDSADAVGTDQEFIKGARLRFTGRGRALEWAEISDGLKLPTTTAFDHPTPKALAQYLASALDSRPSTTAQVSERSRFASNNENCVPTRIPANL